MLSLFLLSGLIAAAAAQNSTNNNTCVSGNAVHMIVARASLEPPGTGIIGNVSTRVADQLAGSNVVAVDYPATISGYTTSERAGVNAMMKLVTDYSSSCPDSKMVLMGYSQGAQVAADVVCGTSENQFNTSMALSTSISSKIAAVVLMGDPSHVVGQPIDQGTSTKNGIFPRTNTAGCNAVADRMVSFCNANDTFCDSGSSIEVHLSYVQNNGTSAVDFITQMVKSASGSGNLTSSSVSGGATTASRNTASRSVGGSTAALALIMGFAWHLVL